MDKSEELAGRIEKLIVDGNKEVIGRVEKLRLEMRDTEGRLDKKIDGAEGRLDKKIGALDKKADLYYKMLDYDIKEVDKLDEHVRQPHGEVLLVAAY